jgi:hypothetical protein
VSLLGGLDLNESESTLNVVQDSELVTGLWDSDDVHQTNWVFEVSSGDTINLDLVALFLKDNLSLLSSQSVFKLFLENEGQRNGFSELVWSLGWSGSLYPSNSEYVSKSLT